MSKSKNSLQQALSMNRSLDIKPEKENISKDEKIEKLKLALNKLEVESNNPIN